MSKPSAQSFWVIFGQECIVRSHNIAIFGLFMQMTWYFNLFISQELLSTVPITVLLHWISVTNHLTLIISSQKGDHPFLPWTIKWHVNSKYCLCHTFGDFVVFLLFLFFFHYIGDGEFLYTLNIWQNVLDFMAWLATVHWLSGTSWL